MNAILWHSGRGNMEKNLNVGVFVCGNNEFAAAFSVIAWIFVEMTILQIPLFCVILKVVMFYANCQLQSWAS